MTVTEHPFIDHNAQLCSQCYPPRLSHQPPGATPRDQLWVVEVVWVFSSVCYLVDLDFALLLLPAVKVSRDVVQHRAASQTSRTERGASLYLARPAL